MLRPALQLFKSPLRATRANLFLGHVLRGEQSATYALLKQTPALAFVRGTAIDYSGRPFENFTAMQAALWGFDWHMWKMLKPFIPKEELIQQALELETEPKEHGCCYDFDELLNPTRVYLENFDKWSCEQLGVQWCKGIGTALSKAPAHVAHEMCHPRRSFLPLPSFTEKELPRNLHITGDVYFFPLGNYSVGRMGTDFAPFRWNGKSAGIGTMKPCPNARVSAQTDLDALTHLKHVRHKQRAEFMSSLGIEPIKTSRMKK